MTMQEIMNEVAKHYASTKHQNIKSILNQSRMGVDIVCECGKSWLLEMREINRNAIDWIDIVGSIEEAKRVPIEYGKSFIPDLDI